MGVPNRKSAYLKSRDITLPTKVHLVKAMFFPVVMYGCESWTVKKAECQRIDAFELWCWRRLLRVPWTAAIIEKAREFQKNIYFCFIDYTKAFVWITINCGKF